MFIFKPNESIQEHQIKLCYQCNKSHVSSATFMQLFNILNILRGYGCYYSALNHYNEISNSASNLILYTHMEDYLHHA